MEVSQRICFLQQWIRIPFVTCAVILPFLIAFSGGVSFGQKPSLSEPSLSEQSLSEQSLSEQSSPEASPIVGDKSDESAKVVQTTDIEIYVNDFEESETGAYTTKDLDLEWNSPSFSNGVGIEKDLVTNDKDPKDKAKVDGSGDAGKRKKQAQELRDRGKGRVEVVETKGLSAVGLGQEGLALLGEKCLAVHYPQGGYGPEKSGAQWKLTLPSGYEELTVEYRVMFGEGFNFVRGGKLPGLMGGKGNTGGQKPNGKDGWSARVHWRTNGSQGSRLLSDKAALSQYVYHPEQPEKHGEDFRWDNDWKRGWARVRSGQWYLIRQRVVMNQVGKKDGMIQVWLDGDLVLDEQRLRFRDDRNLKIDHLYFSTFFGGSGKKWAARRNEVVYFDGFRIFAPALSKLKTK